LINYRIIFSHARCLQIDAENKISKPNRPGLVTNEWAGDASLSETLPPAYCKMSVEGLFIVFIMKSRPGGNRQCLNGDRAAGIWGCRRLKDGRYQVPGF
jgi:hypothetical protein